MQYSATQVREQVEETMNAFAALDLEGFMTGLADKVSAFEMDLENKSLRLESREDIVSWAEKTFAALKKMDAHLRLDLHSHTCFVASEFAYCTVEFDLVAKMGDGSMMTQPTRNTVVLLKNGTNWKWVHWHSSPGAPSA